MIFGAKVTLFSVQRSKLLTPESITVSARVNGQKGKNKGHMRLILSLLVVVTAVGQSDIWSYLPICAVSQKHSLKFNCSTLVGMCILGEKSID